MGCPIRKFTDQSLFAAPHDLSQRTTSFIASQHQGIHRILLRHLITLIIDALPSVIAKRSSDDNLTEVAGHRDRASDRRLQSAAAPCARRGGGPDLRTTSLKVAR